MSIAYIMYLEKSATLFREASALIQELNLITIASKYSDPRIIGSVPAELMVDRDIDISCFCDRVLPLSEYMQFAQELMEIPEITTLRIRDQRSTPNYSPFKINVDEVMYKNNVWKVAFSFIIGSFGVDNPHAKLIAELKNLPVEKKETILRLKTEALAQEYKIPSYFIYRAVIDDNSTDLDDIEINLKNYERV